MDKTNDTIKEIVLVSLPEALKSMEVGETRLAPSDCTDGYVRTKCSELNKKGYSFSTYIKNNRRYITRTE